VSTAPGKLIDEVLRLGPAPYLKESGFKKRARKFFHSQATSTAHIEFQASQWNMASQARFTINLGRYFPAIAEANCQPIVEEPSKQHLLSAGIRIGHLLPQPQDYWWSIEPDTDLQALAAELVTVLKNFAFPYLERISTLEGIAEHAGHSPVSGRYPTLSVASALLLLGRREEAFTVFREYRSGFPRPQPHHEAWASRHGEAGA
jgi:hypothetical protein